MDDWTDHIEHKEHLRSASWNAANAASTNYNPTMSTTTIALMTRSPSRLAANSTSRHWNNQAAANGFHQVKSVVGGAGARSSALNSESGQLRSKSELRFTGNSDQSSRHQSSRISPLYKSLQEDTLGAYARAYCQGRSLQANAEKVWSDAVTFTSKSWLGRLELAQQMVRSNVVSRFRQPQQSIEHPQHPTPILINTNTNSSSSKSDTVNDCRRPRLTPSAPAAAAASVPKQSSNTESDDDENDLPFFFLLLIY